MPWSQVNCFKLALKRPLRPGFCQIHCPDTYKLSYLFVLPLLDYCGFLRPEPMPKTNLIVA